MNDKLPVYGVVRNCAKCGYPNDNIEDLGPIETKYVKAKVRERESSTCTLHYETYTVPEYLRRICPQCQHTWPEACAEIKT